MATGTPTTAAADATTTAPPLSSHPRDFYHHSTVFVPGASPVEIPRAALYEDLAATLRVVLQEFGGEGGSHSMRRSDGKMKAKPSDCPTVYLDVPGVAHALLHVYQATRGDAEFARSVQTPELLLAAAKKIMLRQLPHAHLVVDPSVPAKTLVKHGLGYYCGAPGFLTLLGSVLCASGEAAAAVPYWARLFEFAPIASAAADDDGVQLASEFLYGRAGYLFCLRHARTHCGVAVPSDTVRPILKAILHDGRSNATKQWPLMWQFHRRRYLGAAHGFAGIVLELMLWADALDAAELNEVKAAITAVAERVVAHPERGLQFETRDTDGRDDPTANDRTPNPCINHWCHGFPGLIPVLVQAHETFDKNTETGAAAVSSVFLRAADAAADVVFREGLLVKGGGLCHGAYGNAYPFLSLFRATRNQKYLFYAVHFYNTARSDEAYKTVVREFADPYRVTVGVPDTPLSLMEGIGGSLCFFADLLHPATSCFPGFEDRPKV